MEKILKPVIYIVFACLLIPNALYAAEAVEEKVKDTPVVPETKSLPAAPTIKDVAEKLKTEDIVLKKLAEAPVSGPYDEYNRSTPRSSLLAFSLAVKERDYERAVNYLDLRNLPFSLDRELNGPDLVRKLIVVADRAMGVDILDLSDDPLGHEDDGLKSYRDRITTVKTKDGPVDILMQRVPRGDGVFIWKISNATVAMIPALNAEFGYGVIGDKLSLIFPHYVIFGLEIWQIVMLMALLIMGFVIAYIVTFIITKLLQTNQRINKQRVQQFVVGPLRFLITILIFRATFDMVAPSLMVRALFEAKTLLIIALLWIMLGFVDLIVYRLADRMKRQGQNDAVVLLKPASTGIKLLITLIAIISWMDNLGYQVTTILAGLGVGGVAVALAMQKSVENLIGSITIYASQPVHVGDFCKFGEHLGVVEEIGLRATQLRTLDRSVVFIPNAQFAYGVIENLTLRDKVLYRTRLRLSYKDTPDQVKQVLAKIRELIDQHEFIDEENSRVRFLEFGEYAQELELFAYIKTKDFAEYLECREDINLKINDIVDAVGVELIIPAKTTYLKQPDADPS